MPSVLDIDHTLFIDLRAHIIAAFCHQSKRCKHIHFCDRFRSRLDALHLGSDLIADITINLIFQRIQFVFCTKNGIFQFF